MFYYYYYYYYYYYERYNRDNNLSLAALQQNCGIQSLER